jgi:hypothetical protein
MVEYLLGYGKSQRIAGVNVWFENQLSVIRNQAYDSCELGGLVREQPEIHLQLL